MTAFEIANLAVASVNALAAAVAAVGVWPVRASDERGQQQRAATQQQREAEERRHEESMTALKALPDRRAGNRRRTNDADGRRGGGAPDALPRRRDLEVERLSRGAQVPAPSFVTDRGADAPPVSASNGGRRQRRGAKLDE